MSQLKGTDERLTEYGAALSSNFVDLSKISNYGTRFESISAKVILFVVSLIHDLQNKMHKFICIFLQSLVVMLNIMQTVRFTFEKF